MTDRADLLAILRWAKVDLFDTLAPDALGREIGARGWKPVTDRDIRKAVYAYNTIRRQRGDHGYLLQQPGSFLRYGPNDVVPVF